MADNRYIPVVCGPTGSGKTAVALHLARKVPLEIVSADSRQTIRNLDVGTAKPTAEEREQVKFHLVDIVDPGERYTAFRFFEDANRAMDEILGRSHVPVVVGGTGLYLRALTEGVVEIHADDMAVRERLEKEMEQLGADVMFKQLREIDPAEASKLHPNNKARIIRALEMYLLTGKTKTELTASEKYARSNHNFRYFCLQPVRHTLYQRINDRVDAMMQGGLLEEIENLVKDGQRDAVRKSNVIGYNELLDFLENKCSLEEAVSMIKQNSRRYAKRQMTWFRHQTDCRMFDNQQDMVRYLETEAERFLR